MSLLLIYHVYIYIHDNPSEELWRLLGLKTSQSTEGVPIIRHVDDSLLQP